MEESVQEFLKGLKELSARTGVFVGGCGRCDGSLAYAVLAPGEVRTYSCENAADDGFSFKVGPPER